MEPVLVHSTIESDILIAFLLPITTFEACSCTTVLLTTREILEMKITEKDYAGSLKTRAINYNRTSNTNFIKPQTTKRIGES